MALELLEEYLAQLPAGLASYPEAQHKGSVLRAFCEGTQVEQHVAALPSELQALIKHPPAASSWTTEVQANALYLAIAELCFPSGDAWVEFAHRANRRLLEGPLYAMLFRLFGAKRLAAGIAGRWEQMHRGTQLTLTGFEPGTARFLLRTPRRLMTPLIVRSYATAARAAFEVAGEKNVEGGVGAVADDAIEFFAKWTQ